MGTDGVAQVNTTGLIAAAFDHRDSRAGDPNLHTHVVISNKVQAIGPDGIPRWLALDGRRSQSQGRRHRSFTTPASRR